MAIPRRLSRRIAAVAIAAVIFGIAMSAVQASPDQAPAPAPAPGPGVSYSDGATLDQGIACVLMLLALVLTYIIHAADVTAGF